MYATKQDAFEQAIIPALQEYAAEYDLDAIFDATFEWRGTGFEQRVSTGEFWNAVSEATL